MTTKMIDTTNFDRFIKALFVSVLPVPMATILLSIFFASTEGAFSTDGFLTLMFWGYLVGIIPSLFFSMLMEFVVKPSFSENEKIALIGSIFGFIAGVIIVILIRGVDDADRSSEHFALIIIGGLVGYAMGTLFSHPESKIIST